MGEGKSTAIIILFNEIIMAELVRVEKITEKEKSELAAAEKKVREAREEIEEMRKKIADAHGMKTENWMEWRLWIEFDGDFILLHYQPKMTGHEIKAR